MPETLDNILRLKVKTSSVHNIKRNFLIYRKDDFVYNHRIIDNFPRIVKNMKFIPVSQGAKCMGKPKWFSYYEFNFIIRRIFFMIRYNT